MHDEEMFARAIAKEAKKEEDQIKETLADRYGLFKERQEQDQSKSYHIYHIIGRKIGCTIQPEIRIMSQLKEDEDFEILESTTNIYKASRRERELQKEYGYRIDHQPYYQTIGLRNNKD